MKRIASGLRVGVAVVALASAAFAAGAAKRPLSHADYDAWRSIGATVLSPDGRWLAYGFHPQDGDGDLIVRDLRTGREFKHPVGALPPPPLPDPGSETPPEPRAIKIVFTGDGKWVVATTYPPKAETDAARRAKKKPEEMPQTGIVIVNLANGEAQRVPNVKSVQTAEKAGAWAAWLSVAPPGSKRDDGTDLTLRNLETGADRKYTKVREYGLSRDAGKLWFASNANDNDASGESNGVYLVRPGAEGEPVALASGKAKFSKVATDRVQKRLAFFRTADGTGAKTDVYLCEIGAAPASRLEGIVPPQNFEVSDKGALSFSRDGERLFVPMAASKPASAKKPDAADSGRVMLDLWHYADPLVQPMQKIRATQDRNRTYRGVWHIAAKRYVQLADEDLRTVTTDDSGLAGIGMDARPYQRMVDFDATYNDVYVVSGLTGVRRKAIEKMRGGPGGGGVTISPDGQWGLFYRDKHWHSLDLQTLAVKNLTRALGVAFHNENNDMPGDPGAYGNGGWLKDSKSAVVYDRFDAWRVFVDGSAAVNLTSGEGRKSRIQLRVARIDPQDDEEDSRYLDAARRLHLRGESELTRETGFFEASFQGGAPRRMLWGAKNYSVAARAKGADTLILKAERFDEFPDLHATDSTLRKLARVSNGAAQMTPFQWGAAELIRYRNADGVALQAALFKPANFDPRKKYPLIVYIYERLSQTLHGFVPPAPGASINTTYYTSNGYVVLRPDIVYTEGQPGQSALRCVLPAVNAAVALGFVDERNIGIQGHSWGGYQIAYMLTQTRLFKAAEAGAPVGNMTSAYSGIRWGTGMPRQFQYEKTQSRIGEPLVSAPLKYFENSPVFFADRVTTPLLILHNDNDDAVPWYQGIELFLALRRQGKEAYLFNYNGEFHSLRRRWNQKDYTVRMQQFFDHHLKGAAAPEWMRNGIPYLDREEEKQRFQQVLATDPR